MGKLYSKYEEQLRAVIYDVPAYQQQCKAIEVAINLFEEEFCELENRLMKAITEIHNETN